MYMSLFLDFHLFHSSIPLRTHLSHTVSSSPGKSLFRFSSRSLGKISSPEALSFFLTALCNRFATHWFLKEQIGVLVTETYILKTQKPELHATADEAPESDAPSLDPTVSSSMECDRGMGPKGAVDRARKEETESRRLHRGWASPGAS